MSARWCTYCGWEFHLDPSDRGVAEHLQQVHGISPDPLVVCPDCQGTGNDQDTELVFTGSDLDEWYGDDFGERDQFVADYRAGYYSKPCPACEGRRVVANPDLAD